MYINIRDDTVEKNYKKKLILLDMKDVVGTPKEQWTQ